MKTNSILVYFPGYPFKPEALLPDRQLAAAAGCLLDSGHITQIRDYGTLEFIDQAFPHAVRAAVRGIADRFFAEAPMTSAAVLSTLWQVRRTDRAFRKVQECLQAEIADDLATIEELDFVCFKLGDSDDFHGAKGLACRLREKRPGMTLVVLGPFADLFGEAILADTNVFDCACIGDAEAGLVELAERLEDRVAWAKVPNLIYRVNGRVHHTQRQSHLDLGALPAPAYEPGVYPALEDTGKLKLFEVEDSRGCACHCYACPQVEREASNGLRMKPVNTIYAELWRLGVLYGARAFHFCGAASPPSHMTALARELIARGLDLCYSRAAHVRYADPAIFPALITSGCKVLSCQVDTGSQRLLDEQYGRAVSVTQIEEVLRASKSAGLFTLARLTYPSPGDDHHTRAEMLRLVDRTCPHAAPVALPEALPGSAWFTWGRAFGFAFDQESYMRQSLSYLTKFPVPAHRWRVLPHMVGTLSPSQAIRANEQLAAEIEHRGIPSYCTETVALAAEVCGLEDGARGFGKRMLRQLLTGDLAGLAALVDRFNEAACGERVAPFAVKPFVPMQDAVGN